MRKQLPKRLETFENSFCASDLFLAFVERIKPMRRSSNVLKGHRVLNNVDPKAKRSFYVLFLFFTTLYEKQS